MLTMPLVVLPSEITEGPLPQNKCLRGFVVDKKTKTVAGGKVVVEIHVAAKDDPGGGVWRKVGGSHFLQK